MDEAALKASGWWTVNPGGFTEVVGPFWIRGDGAEREAGLLIEARHSNNHMGTIHGGVVMTFADIGLGVGVAEAHGAKNLVTTQVNIHFVSTAKVGDFITCKPEVVRRGAQLIFVRGLICVGEKVIASADGIWKVIEMRGPRDAGA